MQLVSIFPTILFFISLIARAIPHSAQRRQVLVQSGVREAIRGLDETFVFNAIIDSFTLSVANGLILMFVFDAVETGFVFMFFCIALCVFSFSALHAKSLMGMSFLLFFLGLIFVIELAYFLAFGLSFNVFGLILTDLEVAISLPAAIIGIFLVLMYLVGRRQRSKPTSDGMNKGF